MIVQIKSLIIALCEKSDFSCSTKSSISTPEHETSIENESEAFLAARGTGNKRVGPWLWVKVVITARPVHEKHAP